MTKNSIIWTIRVGAVATAIMLIFAALGCSSDDDNGTKSSLGESGAGGSDEGAEKGLLQHDRCSTTRRFDGRGGTVRFGAGLVE